MSVTSGCRLESESQIYKTEVSKACPEVYYYSSMQEDNMLIFFVCLEMKNNLVINSN